MGEINVKEHLSFSMYTFVVYTVAQITQAPSLELAGGFIVGSMLPDCDHPNGTISKILPAWRLKNKKKGSKAYFKHGGITHTILINIIIFVISFYYDNTFGIGVGWGYASHLYADDITGNKLNMLYYPFKRK